MKKTSLVILLIVFSISTFAQVLLHDTGPLVNSPGTGAGGADESIMQNSSLGLNTLGGGFQLLNGNRIADDFVLASDQNINKLEFFAYQTGSTTASTITGVYVQIWDGAPNGGGSIVWGDLVTNRLTSTSWSNIYRVKETTLGATDRPIMSCLCDVNINLPAGTYWIDVMVDGSLGSGPWCPHITINGQTTTGNSIQFTGAWGNLLDIGTSTQQGMPFKLYSSPAVAVPVSPWSIVLAFGLIGGFVAVRMFRRTKKNYQAELL